MAGLLNYGQSSGFDITYGSSDLTMLRLNYIASYPQEQLQNQEFFQLSAYFSTIAMKVETTTIRGVINGESEDVDPT